MKTDIEKYEDVKTRNIYEEKSNNLSLKKEYGLSEKLIRDLSYEKDVNTEELKIERLRSLILQETLNTMQITA